MPQRQLTAAAHRHLATLMVELGWSAVRVRDLTRGGFKERVRGYVPDARAALERGTGQSTADGLTTPLASKGFRNGV